MTAARDLGSGARQRVIVTANATYVLTQSSGPEAEFELVSARIAKVEAFDAVAENLRNQDGVLSVETSGFAMTTVSTGYSLEYSNGLTTVTLAVNPIEPGTNLAFSDQLAGLVPIRVVNGHETVLETYGSESQPQLHWIQDGALVSLVAPAERLESLQANVVKGVSRTFDDVERSITESVLASPAEVEADVDGILVSKHLGSDNSGGFLCGKSVRSSDATCTAFAAVGSLAVFELDQQWYVVALVPSEKPTTTFRTEPTVTFTTAISGPWSVSLAKVPAHVSSITLRYSTDGVPTELSTEITLV